MTHCKIKIGNIAGGGFQPDGSMECARHATRTHPCGRVERGYYVCRKWLADRAAFNYDPTLGWAYDRWFEWEVAK